MANFLEGSVITKGDDTITDKVWNVYTIQKVTDINLKKKVEAKYGGEFQMTKKEKNLKEACKDGRGKLL